MKHFSLLLITLILILSCDTSEQLLVNGSIIHEETTDCGYFSVEASTYIVDVVKLSFNGNFEICPSSLIVRFNKSIIDNSNIMFYYNGEYVRNPNVIIQTVDKSELLVKINNDFPIKYSKNSIIEIMPSDFIKCKSGQIIKDVILIGRRKGLSNKRQ